MVPENNSLKKHDLKNSHEPESVDIYIGQCKMQTADQG